MRLQICPECDGEGVNLLNEQCECCEGEGEVDERDRPDLFEDDDNWDDED